MKTIALALLSFFVVSSAHADLSCESVNGNQHSSFEIKQDKNGDPIVSDQLCFGGKDMEIEKTKNHVIITCGDDGRATTTLDNFYVKSARKNAKCEYTKSGRIDWKATNALQGTQYSNLSSGYPYSDGLVSYITCCSN